MTGVGEILFLAGFALAHAAWSVSDGADPLITFAVVESAHGRELHRFPAGTGQARAVMFEDHAASAWVLASQERLDIDGEAHTTLFIETSADADGHQIAVIQVFVPGAGDGFQLVGAPRVLGPGIGEDPPDLVRDLAAGMLHTRRRCHSSPTCRSISRRRCDSQQSERVAWPKLPQEH